MFVVFAWLAAAGALHAQDKAKPKAEEPTQLTLFLGEVRTLPITNVQRVAVGSGRVLTTTVLEKEVLLLAENPGDTGLFIWLKDGTVNKFNVRVTQIDVGDTYRQLRTILSGIPGVKVERVGDQVVLTGATTKANLQRISSIAGNYKQVVNVVREEEVTMRKMVFLKVQLVEFKRSALQNLGIRWASEITGPAGAFAFDVITSGGFTVRQPDQALAGVALPPRVSPPRAYLGVATAITSRINLAVENGDAYVLATPELSTRSGGEAKFLAGGQIPIVVPASGFSPPSVTYKDYGIKLTINPTADENNNIVALIKSEVSSIDPATSVQGNPGFLTRQSDSEINVRDGQTIVISGLVNADLSNQVNKFPWLGDLPILGHLFRSTEFRNNRTDLVVFVTPQIYDPNSTLNRERIEKGRELRERFEGFLGKKGIVD
jgi:pilus assembly protein CpaC